MSHVFISYKSEDQFQLQALIEVLKKADIPYWNDDRIRAGNDWRDEIDAAIEQSFALIVILTDNAANSHYVTYEWSLALGKGIKIIPLLFQEKLPSNLHVRLKSIEYVLCFPRIPESSLCNEILVYKDKTFLAKAVENQLLRILLTSRVLVRYSIWMYRVIPKLPHAVHLGWWTGMLSIVVAYLYRIRKNALPQFWMATAHAFSTNQRQHFEIVSIEIEKLYRSVSRINDCYADEKMKSDFNAPTNSISLDFLAHASEIVPAFESLEERLNELHSDSKFADSFSYVLSQMEATAPTFLSEHLHDFDFHMTVLAIDELSMDSEDFQFLYQVKKVITLSEVVHG